MQPDGGVVTVEKEIFYCFVNMWSTRYALERSFETRRAAVCCIYCWSKRRKKTGDLIFPALMAAGAHAACEKRYFSSCEERSMKSMPVAIPSPAGIPVFLVSTIEQTRIALQWILSFCGAPHNCTVRSTHPPAMASPAPPAAAPPTAAPAAHDAGRKVIDAPVLAAAPARNVPADDGAPPAPALLTGTSQQPAATAAAAVSQDVLAAGAAALPGVVDRTTTSKSSHCSALQQYHIDDTWASCQEPRFPLPPLPFLFHLRFTRETRATLFLHLVARAPPSFSSSASVSVPLSRVNADKQSGMKRSLAAAQAASLTATAGVVGTRSSAASTVSSPRAAVHAVAVADNKEERKEDDLCGADVCEGSCDVCRVPTAPADGHLPDVFNHKHSAAAIVSGALNTTAVAAKTSGAISSSLPSDGGPGTPAAAAVAVASSVVSSSPSSVCAATNLRKASGVAPQRSSSGTAASRIAGGMKTRALPAARFGIPDVHYTDVLGPPLGTSTDFKKTFPCSVEEFSFSPLSSSAASLLSDGCFPALFEAAKQLHGAVGVYVSPLGGSLLSLLRSHIAPSTVSTDTPLSTSCVPSSLLASSRLTKARPNNVEMLPTRGVHAAATTSAATATATGPEAAVAVAAQLRKRVATTSQDERGATARNAPVASYSYLPLTTKKKIGEVVSQNAAGVGVSSSDPSSKPLFKHSNTSSCRENSNPVVLQHNSTLGRFGCLSALFLTTPAAIFMVVFPAFSTESSAANVFSCCPSSCSNAAGTHFPPTPHFAATLPSISPALCHPFSCATASDSSPSGTAASVAAAACESASSSAAAASFSDAAAAFSSAASVSPSFSPSAVACEVGNAAAASSNRSPVPVTLHSLRRDAHDRFTAAPAASAFAASTEHDAMAMLLGSFLFGNSCLVKVLYNGSALLSTLLWQYNISCCNVADLHAAAALLLRTDSTVAAAAEELSSSLTFASVLARRFPTVARKLLKLQSHAKQRQQQQQQEQQQQHEQQHHQLQHQQHRQEQEVFLQFEMEEEGSCSPSDILRQPQKREQRFAQQQRMVARLLDRQQQHQEENTLGSWGVPEEQRTCRFKEEAEEDANGNLLQQQRLWPREQPRQHLVEPRLSERETQHQQVEREVKEKQFTLSKPRQQEVDREQTFPKKSEEQYLIVEPQQLVPGPQHLVVELQQPSSVELQGNSVMQTSLTCESFAAAHILPLFLDMCVALNDTKAEFIRERSEATTVRAASLNSSLSVKPKLSSAAVRAAASAAAGLLQSDTELQQKASLRSQQVVRQREGTDNRRKSVFGSSRSSMYIRNTGSTSECRGGCGEVMKGRGDGFQEQQLYEICRNSSNSSTKESEQQRRPVAGTVSLKYDTCAAHALGTPATVAAAVAPAAPPLSADVVSDIVAPEISSAAEIASVSSLSHKEPFSRNQNSFAIPTKMLPVLRKSWKDALANATTGVASGGDDDASAHDVDGQQERERGRPISEIYKGMQFEGMLLQRMRGDLLFFDINYGKFMGVAAGAVATGPFADLAVGDVTMCCVTGKSNCGAYIFLQRMGGEKLVYDLRSKSMLPLPSTPALALPIPHLPSSDSARLAAAAAVAASVGSTALSAAPALVAAAAASGSGPTTAKAAAASLGWRPPKLVR